MKKRNSKSCLRAAACAVIAILLSRDFAMAQKSNFDAFFKTKDMEARFAHIPAELRQRMAPELRTIAMEKFGGKEKSEKTILAALRWLKDHQNADGSWSDACRPSMTGFALLCFLGHGELPASPEFGPAITKGVEWMRTRAVEYNGRMSLTKEGWEGCRCL